MKFKPVQQQYITGPPVRFGGGYEKQTNKQTDDEVSNLSSSGKEHC